MSLKKRILAIENEAPDRLKDKYLPDNYDDKLDDLCRESKEMEWEVNCLVYLLDTYGIDLLLDYSLPTEEEIDKSGVRFIRAMDDEDYNVYYNHPELFVERLKNYFWDFKPDITINEEAVRQLITQHPVDKYRHLKAMCFLIEHYMFARSTDYERQTPEEYMASVFQEIKHPSQL